MSRFFRFLVFAFFLAFGMPFLSRGQSPQGKESSPKNEDPVARLRNTEPKKHRFPDYNGIESLAFSPDGRFIAASDGLEVLLWDIGAREYRRFSPWPDPGRWTTGSAVAFTPDGKRLVTARDRLCQILDVASGKPDGRSFLGIWSFCCVAVSKDGRFLAAGSQIPKGFMLNMQGTGQPKWHTLRLWKLDDGQDVPLEPVAPLVNTYSVAFSTDSESLIAGGKSNRDSGFIRVFDVKTGKRRYSILPEKPVRDIAISPDGKILACVARRGR